MKIPHPDDAPVPFSHEYELDVDQRQARHVVEPTALTTSGLFFESEARFIGQPSNGRHNNDGACNDGAGNDEGVEKHHDNNNDDAITATRNNDGTDFYAIRKAIEERDRSERLLSRQRKREQRQKRQRERRTFQRAAHRRPPLARSWKLDPQRKQHTRGNADVPQLSPVGNERGGAQSKRTVSTGADRLEHSDRHNLESATSSMKIGTSSRLQATALVLYFILLPYVIFTRWQSAPETTHADAIRVLLVLLTLCWCGFVIQFVRDIQRISRGDRSRRSGSAWLAGLVVALLPFFASTSSGASPVVPPLSIHFEPAPATHIAHFATPKVPAGALGGLMPLALVSRRKPSELDNNKFAQLDSEILTRVELLRADPQVLGLIEPFTPTLRRRCIEMVAYLALHRHEPVTGERLRTRVLTHADVDASLRTLANTASAVRRSLGSDSQGPRLHSVTSSGLYATHGITSDVEIFSRMVSEARTLSIAEGAVLARQALLLVQGEPMASALRGYEWFLSEGHGAALARDGEWAALIVHHDALSSGQYELAFWALRQGLLVDPYSDVLLSAINRVPRLREFGSDRGSRAKHQAISSGSAVAMSWALTGFSNQVSQ
jgi:hypothetical protein